MAGENLLPSNPGFESTDVSMWQGGVPLTRVTDDHIFGNACGQITTIVADGVNAGAGRTAAPITAGTHTISYYARARPGSVGVFVDCQVNVLDAAFALLSYEHGGEQPLALAWRRIQYTFVAAANAVWASPYFTIGDSQAPVNATWLIDGCKIERGAQATPYTDDIPYAGVPETVSSWSNLMSEDRLQVQRGSPPPQWYGGGKVGLK